MPLDSGEVLGTEKDGTKSAVYCKFCYRDGKFVQPHMTLEGMREHLLGLKPAEMTEEQMQEHLEGLKYLRRWLDEAPGGR